MSAQNSYISVCKINVSYLMVLCNASDDIFRWLHNARIFLVTGIQGPENPCFRQVVIPQMWSAASPDSDGNHEPQIQISTESRNTSDISRWELAKFTPPPASN